jgi:hypothetical protein
MMPELSEVPVFLRGLAEEIAVELWKVARREPTTTRLVLPTYRNGRHRVSEKEARAIAQRLVADSDYYFSIETPTDGLYKFSGKDSTPHRSASHDMSLYLSAEPASIAAHVEFKQGHRSRDAGIQVIAKDLEKLVGSARHSLWFHSFPKPTRNEFQKLQTFFAPAMGRVSANPLPSEARVVLAFCAVIEPVVWVAGPVSWDEVPALIAQFPVACARVHSAWSKHGPSQALKPTRDDLAFENDDDEGTGD